MYTEIEYLTAIVAMFEASPALKVVFPNGLWRNEARDKETPGLSCVFNVTQSADEYNTGSNHPAILLIDFNVFKTTDTECYAAVDLIETLFHNQPLNVAGFIQTLKAPGKDVFEIDDEEWQGVVSFYFHVTLGG